MQRTSIATANTPTAIWTPDATNDVVIKKIMVSSSDTSIQAFRLYLHDGTNDDLMGLVDIPVTAGTENAVPPVDVAAELPALFSEMDNANNACLMIPAGCGLKASVDAITTDKLFKVWVFVEKYD